MTAGGAAASTGRNMLLAIDSATTRVVVALGTIAGTLVEAVEWPAGYRHGETLLPAIAGLLDRLAIDRASIAGIVVGTGPGAFTGLRVGIATAKGLAHALGVPIVGVSTADALLADAPDDMVLLLPAGPADRLVVRTGGPARLLPAGEEPDDVAADRLMAIDLPDRAPAAALERGELARARLGAALVAHGATRFADGVGDDIAAVVPEYVTLPRGVRAGGGEIEWSRDPR